MEKSPVYGIRDFDGAGGDAGFYANHLHLHVREHGFTRFPHKHDFYFLMLVTGGSGWHEIDFTRYSIRAGSIFVMQPGQMHCWELSPSTRGYVLFHSRSFFEEAQGALTLSDFPFFRSLQAANATHGRFPIVRKLSAVMREALWESQGDQPYRSHRLRSLLTQAYIELARVYPSNQLPSEERYLQHFHHFENLLDAHFLKEKQPAFYADKMALTVKHLNRVSRECVNKTSGRLIGERVVLEAKRILMRQGITVAEAGEALGFDDPSHFTRYFRKFTGRTPVGFRKRYKR